MSHCFGFWRDKFPHVWSEWWSNVFVSVIPEGFSFQQSRLHSCSRSAVGCNSWNCHSALLQPPSCQTFKEKLDIKFVKLHDELFCCVSLLIRQMHFSFSSASSDRRCYLSLDYSSCHFSASCRQTALEMEPQILLYVAPPHLNLMLPPLSWLTAAALCSELINVSIISLFVCGKAFPALKQHFFQVSISSWWVPGQAWWGAHISRHLRFRSAVYAKS